MVDKVPGDITAGTASDDSKVHATQADNSLSRAHTERGISRLQGTAPDYSASKTYALNDIITQDDAVFRCTIAITIPEVFNASKWQSISSSVHESQWKEPVLLTTTTNITLSGVQSVDGTNTSDGNRILVKDQTLSENNGIYIADSSTWSRSLDMNAVGEFESAVVATEQGATNASTIWIQTEIVNSIGVDDVEFTVTSFSGKLSDLNIDTEKNWNSARIQSLGNPIGDQDAATKSYVDGLNWKKPVLRATTEQHTLSAQQTIDGTLTTNDERILVKNQTAPAENGIYITNSVLAWTRATDMDESIQFDGAVVYILEGTVNADTSWSQLETVGTVGTSVVIFELFAPNLFTAFSTTKSYRAGSLVVRTNVSLRNPQDVSAGLFDGDQWEILTNAPPFETVNAHRVGDLVRHVNHLYECYNDVVANTTFSLDNFRIPNSAPVFSTRTFTQTVSDNVRIVGIPQNLDGVISHNYSARDISRLQSATQLYSGLVSYNEGDLVLENGIVYRALADISAGELDSITIVNGGSGYTPSGQNGTLTGFKSLAFFADLSIDSIGTAVSFIDLNPGSTGFIQGESVELDPTGPGTGFEGTAVIIVNIFDIDEWIPISGVGAKNVVHVYSEDDFPASIDVNGTDMHMLDNNTHYILAAPTVVTDPLLIDAGFQIQFSAFSKEINLIDYTGGGALFRARNQNSSFGSVVDGGGGEIQFVTGDTLGLGVGDFVNILITTGTDYSEVKAEVTAVATNASFNIVGAIAGTATGIFDRNSLTLEMSEIKFEGDTTNSFISMMFTETSFSEFFMFHTELEKFDEIGTIIDANLCILDLNEFEVIQGPLRIEDTISSSVTGNKWFDSVIGSGIANLEIRGENLITNIHRNTFLSTAPGHAILIDDSGLGQLSANASVIITDNIDSNPLATSLLSTDGADESDVRLTVKNNPGQSPSVTVGNANLGTGTVTISAADTLTAINNENWQPNSDNQRFTVSEEILDGGLFTYTGVEDIQIIIDYSVTFTPSNNQNEDIFAGMFFNGTGVTESYTESDAVDNPDLRSLSGHMMVKMSTGNTFQLGIGSRVTPNPDDIDIARAVVTAFAAS